MLKTIAIIAVTLGMLVGGLLTLRNSTRSGMPSDEVLKRAQEHRAKLAAAEMGQEGATA